MHATRSLASAFLAFPCMARSAAWRTLRCQQATSRPALVTPSAHCRANERRDYGTCETGGYESCPAALFAARLWSGRAVAYDPRWCAICACLCMSGATSHRSPASGRVYTTRACAYYLGAATHLCAEHSVMLHTNPRNLEDRASQLLGGRRH
eukprot:365808-Chlamydomonas_euryale.AAC.22